MNGERWLELKPFADEASSRSVACHARLARDASRLSIEYRLTGSLSEVALPETLANGAARERKDRLWEKTCFELFLAREGQPAYWELNVSPSGDWNIYRFDDYRSAMAPETRARAPRVFAKKTAQDLVLAVELELGAFLPGGGPGLTAGLTAVLESAGGAQSFLALKHAGTKPDFHLRESFVIRI
jgi:hypothetical protein